MCLSRLFKAVLYVSPITNITILSNRFNPKEGWQEEVFCKGKGANRNEQHQEGNMKSTYTFWREIIPRGFLSAGK